MFPSGRTHIVSDSIEDENPHLDDESAWPHSPLAQAHISGEESEAEANDDLADWHSTPWHPKPAAVCPNIIHGVAQLYSYYSSEAIML